MAGFRFSPRPNQAAAIHWRDWGEEPFAEARRQNKPVLLAISAVWCHWCHVMDETSYSVPEIIDAINERFIPIRVDTDARPDVNRRYNMGGWPSTAFLTPDGEILHGGTYMAPEVMYKHSLIVADMWRDKREELLGRLAENRAKEEQARAPKLGDLSPDIVESVGALVRGQYDPLHGGFGREPKFPQPFLLRFLLDEYRRHEQPELRAMATKTLTAMAAGGVFDRIEGGFFRYATMRDWNEPHYEKMLEDNAELLALYVDAHALFPDEGYDRVAREVVRWMDAALYQAETGLWSGSQDADEEYYALDAPSRANRGAPFVDRTLYTSPNALAAAACLRAGDVLRDAALRERGLRAVRAIESRMRGADGALHHVDDGSGRRLPDLLADVAAHLHALLDAGEPDAAAALASRMRERLEAPEGGFYDRPDEPAPGRLARRERPIEDNAAAASALLRLAAITGDDGWRESALRALRSFVGEYRQWGHFAASYADIVAAVLREPIAVVVVGPVEDRTAAALARAARLARDPDVFTQWLVPAERPAVLAARGFPPDRVAAYVCVGTACGAPLADEDSLLGELASARARIASPVA